MKILHTADWHIGKILHKQDLSSDILLFFDWLIEYVQKERIDLVLVAGDIFDLANPSNRDLAIYYSTLRRLSDTGTKVVITGGNHDSVSLLNAASYLLIPMNIIVFGGLTPEYNDHVLEILSRDGSESCAVLAVPYLRDRDLLQSVPVSESEARDRLVPAAVNRIYGSMVSYAAEKFGNKVPVIAMGHLFMKGTFKSDSEREIHIGNLEGLDSDVLPGGITYTALGHIHKPQKVGGKSNIRYCGSPVFLDFSEREYSKMVILLETGNDNKINISEVAVPKFRDMPKITGTLQEVSDQLREYKNLFPLVAIAEVEVTEKSFEPMMHQSANELTNMEFGGHIKVIKNRISYTDRESAIQDESFGQASIKEMSPLDIFRKRLEETDLTPKEKSDLSSLYTQLLEDIKD